MDKQLIELLGKMNEKDMTSDATISSARTYLDKIITVLDSNVTEGSDEADVVKVLAGMDIDTMEDTFTQEQINQAKQTLDANRNNVLATQITLDSAYDISQDTVYQSKLSALDAAKTKLKAKKDMAGFENMIESVGAQTQALQDYVNDFNQAAEAAQLLAEAQQARTDALALPLTQADAGVIVEPGLKQALLTAKAVLEAVTTTGDIQAQVLAYTQALTEYNTAVDALNDAHNLAQQARTDALALPLTQADAGVIVEPGLKQAFDAAKAALNSATTTGDIQAQVLAYTQALGNFNDALDQSNYEAILLHEG